MPDTYQQFTETLDRLPARFPRTEGGVELQEEYLPTLVGEARGSSSRSCAPCRWGKQQ